MTVSHYCTLEQRLIHDRVLQFRWTKPLQIWTLHKTSVTAHGPRVPQFAMFEIKAKWQNLNGDPITYQKLSCSESGKFEFFLQPMEVSVLSLGSTLRVSGRWCFHSESGDAFFDQALWGSCAHWWRCPSSFAFVRRLKIEAVSEGTHQRVLKTSWEWTDGNNFHTYKSVILKVL